MKIVINPTYKVLNSFISNIPVLFDQEGELVYAARNQLKSYIVEGYNVIVKRYKIPHIINQIAYTFFRPSKAKRAYEYALKLIEIGIESPEPIAYIEQYKYGLLTHSYFISVFEKDYSDIRDLMDGLITDDELLKELSFYISDIHSKGVFHLDMSPGNILYNKIDDKLNFKLIDINRMVFLESISKEKRYKSFKRLSGNAVVLAAIAKLYATASELDEAETVRKIKQYSTKFFSSKKLFRTRKSEES